MGNKQSKIKTPYEVLNLDPTSTKGEIRSAYIKLMLLHHPTKQKGSDPQKAVDITNAYTSIKNSPPLFEFYTEELFKKDFIKYASDFYERVGDFCGIVSPNFSQDYMEVYKTFNRFRIYKCGRKFKNEDEKNLFCFNVTRISSIIKKMDSRVIKENPKVLEKRVTSSVSLKREPNIKPYSCEQCKKSFKSKNQLINHYNSKKHLTEIEKLEKDPRLYVQKQIQNISDVIHDEKEDKNELTDFFKNCSLRDDSSSDEDVPDVFETNYVEKVTEKKDCNKNEVKSIRGEPVVFRTCSKCKSVFENRISLLKHIKESHT